MSGGGALDLCDHRVRLRLTQITGDRERAALDAIVLGVEGTKAIDRQTAYLRR